MNKKWELVNFCEFDKYAVKSYCAIHNVDESLNLGDITKVNEKEIADFDMMTWAFLVQILVSLENKKALLTLTEKKQEVVYIMTDYEY